MPLSMNRRISSACFVPVFLLSFASAATCESVSQMVVRFMSQVCHDAIHCQWYFAHGAKQQHRAKILMLPRSPGTDWRELSVDQNFLVNRLGRSEIPKVRNVIF
jgi:hypothetical protein